MLPHQAARVAPVEVGDGLRLTMMAYRRQRLLEDVALPSKRRNFHSIESFNDAYGVTLGAAYAWLFNALQDKRRGAATPTPRANHAAVACGEHMLVFGGWAADGATPLQAAALAGKLEAVRHSAAIL